VSDDFLDPRRAERLTRAARAAQTLSETLWETLHEELSEEPRSERVVELSEQLSEVAATVASLARSGAPARAGADSGPLGEPVAPVGPESRFARARYDQPVADESAVVREPPSRSQASPYPAVLVDELAPAEFESRVQAEPRIEIRDERGEEGPAAWIGSIGRRLERHRQDGSPFAVLLVELVDIERLRHAEPPEEMARLTSQVEDMLARGLRPADSLTRERPGRYWLLAAQADRAGAQALTEWIARTMRSSASHRGRPLEVAVGVAVCPDDGRQASELAAHADVGLYAARAAGRSSIGS
jgi:GGDEF domain-containing protein